jgi:hypothetical protein
MRVCGIYVCHGQLSSCGKVGSGSPICVDPAKAASRLSKSCTHAEAVATGRTWGSTRPRRGASPPSGGNGGGLLSAVGDRSSPAFPRRYLSIAHPRERPRDRPRHQGLPRPCVVTQEVDLLGRTQPNKSALVSRFRRCRLLSEAMSLRPCLSPSSDHRSPDANARSQGPERGHARREDYRAPYRRPRRRLAPGPPRAWRVPAARAMAVIRSRRVRDAGMGGLVQQPAALGSPSAPSRRSKSRNATTPCWNNLPWPRDSNQMASDGCSKRGAGITRTALMSAQNGHLVCPGFAPCGFSHVGTAKLRTFAY